MRDFPGRATKVQKMKNLWIFDTDTLLQMRDECRMVGEQEMNSPAARQAARETRELINQELKARGVDELDECWGGIPFEG